MAEKEKNIANLSMEIDANALKEIVASGNLTEFVENASALAAEQIRVKIYDELGKMAVGASEKGRALNANLAVKVAYYQADDEPRKYGTRCVTPFCHTMCRPFDIDIAYEIAKGVRVGMTEYNKQQMK